MGAQSLAFDLFWTPNDPGETNTFLMPAFELILADMNWLDSVGNPLAGRITAFAPDGNGDEPGGTIAGFTDNSVRVLFPAVFFDPQDLDQIFASFAIEAEHINNGPLPEPTTLALIALGLVACATVRRRRPARKAAVFV